MKNLEENYISIVVVARNNEDNIVTKLNALHKSIADMFKYFEIIVVDNFSTDSTLEKLSSPDFQITVISLSQLHSVQHALTAGVEFAAGDYILEIPDIDNVQDFGCISEMYRTCQKGNDFVFLAPSKLASTSKLFYRILNRYYKGQISEKFVSSIMTLSSRRGQNKTADQGSKIVNRNVSYVLTGLNCAVVHSDAEKTNKRSFVESLDLMFDTLIYHTDYIYQFVIKIALGFFTVSIFAVVYALILFFVMNTAPGWASTFVLIALGFGVLSGVMAAVCKYLSNIIKSSQTKTYTFSSVEKRGAK